MCSVPASVTPYEPTTDRRKAAVAPHPDRRVATAPDRTPHAADRLRSPRHPHHRGQATKQ